MESKEKNSLIRITLSGGKLTADVTGRADGRGAYRAACKRLSRKKLLRGLSVRQSARSRKKNSSDSFKR